MGKGITGEAGGLPKSSLSRPVPVVVKETAIPTRQDAENSKHAVELQANYFGLTFTVKSLTVYKYTFKVLSGSGQENKDAETADIVNFVKGALPSVGAQPDEYATDFQHGIVSLKPLKLPKNANNRFEDEGSGGWAIDFGEAVEVQLGQSALVSPSSDFIACLNLIVGHWTRVEKQTAQVGRHSFFRGFDGPGLEDPMAKANISDSDVSNAYWSGRTFREIFKALNKTTTAGSTARLTELIKLHGAVAKSKVSYELPGKDPKKARIAGFARRDDKDSRSRDPAHPLKIEKDFPTSMEVRFWFKNEYRTVWGHFKKERGLELSKNLPLINIGRPGRPEYVPAEYCRVLGPGEPEQLKKSVLRLPGSKQIWVRSSHNLHEMEPDAGSSQVLRNFHIIVHQNEPLKVTGRELDSPQISYCDKQPVSVPPEASWKFAGKSLAESPKTKSSWTWVYLGGDSQTGIPRFAEEGAKQLQDILKKMCANGSPPQLVNSDDRRVSENAAAIRASLARAAKISDMKLVVVISPNKLSADIYNTLKFSGDIQTGIHTSCILLDKFRKKGKDGQETWNYGYFRNVALKINLKLGGTSHKLEQELDLAKKNALMVMGYGTSRLTRKKKTKSDQGHDSQVGLVISADEKLGQWFSSCWSQEPKQEMTGKTFFEKLQAQLGVWKSCNANALKKPTLRVVIYRNGGSESQFTRVLEEEVAVIRKAFEKEFGTKPIQITLAVAIKGHANRFFPMEPGKDDKSNRNIKPGTIVGNVVTRRSYTESCNWQNYYWQFFLASHFAHKGNTRPTRYVVLLDEAFYEGYVGQPDDPADSSTGNGKLEKFTHDLCYLFGRATKAVSVCTPAYYVDILCKRARAYNAAVAEDMIKWEVEKSQLDASGEQKKRMLAGEIHRNLAKSMHWI